MVTKDFDITFDQTQLCLSNIGNNVSFKPEEVFVNVKALTARTLFLKLKKLYESTVNGVECTAKFLSRIFAKEEIQRLKNYIKRLVLKTGVVSVERAKCYITCLISGKCDQPERFFVELEEVDARKMAFELNHFYNNLNDSAHVRSKEVLSIPFLYSYFGNAYVKEIEDHIRLLLDNTKSVIRCSEKVAESSVGSTRSRHNFGTGRVDKKLSTVAKIRRQSRKPSKCISIPS